MWAGHETARVEAARRWRALPPERRESHADCEAFAQQLTYDLYFSTITDRLKLITAWLILEFDRDCRKAEAAAKARIWAELDARVAASTQWQAGLWANAA